MATEKTYKTPGLIIKKTKLGEADRILTIFTPDMGKIQGFAKSVRKPQSKLSGHLEMLTYSQLTLTKGRGLDTIIGSQNIDSFIDIKDDLYRVSYALYIAELIDYFTDEGTADKDLFEHTIECLQHMGKTSHPMYLLRYFETRMLTYTGFKPEIDNCVICQKELDKSNLGGFSPSAGGMLCLDCREHSRHYGYFLSNSAYKTLRFLEECNIDDLESEVPDPDTIAELEMILRRYIRFVLEKDVRSIPWIDHLKRLSSTVLY